MYSTNGGETWTGPEKFTPDSPILDWKYISIAPINPVVEDNIMVFIVLQGESLELKPNPSLLSAQYYCAVNSQLFYTSAENLSTITDSRLLQNYPNPFNPNTKIEYQIPELSFVTIKVYDVLGNEVRTIVNEEKAAGSYGIKFDGSGLTSGIYFYRLQAGSIVETKKMVLIK